MNFYKCIFQTALACLMTGGALIAAENGNNPGAVPENLTLDECVRLALKQNPQIRTAEQQIKVVQGQIITVRAQALPQLSLTGDYAQVAPPITYTALPFEEKSWAITFQATQLLYSGGQVGAAIKIAKLAGDSTYYSLLDTIDQTISNVRQQFYTVLLDRELIGVEEEAVDVLKSQLSIERTRFKAGTVAHFDVLQDEVALSNELPKLINARNQYVISQVTLAQTLGIDSQYWQPGATSSRIKVTGDLNLSYHPVNQDEAIRAAKEYRPSLKVQRQNILEQLQEIKVALAGYQPQVSANAAEEIENSPATQKLTDVVTGWFWGVNANWAVFDGLATYGKVKTARASLESAKTSYDSAVLQVELQVEQAVANLREAHESLLSQEKGVDEAREALRLSKVRYDAGTGIQLDVLNAQESLAQARINELQAKHDYGVARAQFDYATGAETRYKDLFDDPLTHKRRPAHETTAAR